MAHLLIIELPEENDADILNAIIARGDTFTFLSANLLNYKLHPAIAERLGFARELINMDICSYTDIEQKIFRLHYIFNINGIICFELHFLTEAAKLAENLKIPFLNSKTAKLLSDKYLMRQKLASTTNRQPEFRITASSDELKRAIEELGLPALISTINGYTSEPIILYQLPDDEQLKNLITTHKTTHRLLVEKFIDGKIISYTTFTHEGKHQLIGEHENTFFDFSPAVMRGSVFSEKIENRPAMENFIFPLLNSINFNHGAACIDIIMRPEGPYLLSITPQLATGKVPQLMGLVLNRRIYSDLIALHLGKAYLQSSQTHGNYAAIRWFAAPKQGRFHFVEYAANKNEATQRVAIIKKYGDIIRPPITNADRLGYVISCLPQKEMAVASAEDFINHSIIFYMNPS